MIEESLLSGLPLFPPQASSVAERVDALFLFLVGLSIFFGLLISALLIGFGIRYRRRPGSDPPVPIHGSLKLELLWSLIPLALSMVIFVWAASLFFHLSRPPDDAMTVSVVGKRWMWKIQHPNGKREINELHVPVGRSVRLNMTSEDVIHSFFVPAFRIKADVLPGRYSSAWFRATRPGRYYLFCTEYCGTEHSGMVGWVYAMEPADFQTWLGGGPAPVSMAAAGRKLFSDLGCVTCHARGSTERGPTLENVFGSEVRLEDGRAVIADETYLRESIVNPGARIVSGYRAVMPTFQGLVNEEGILQLIEYIKTLSPETPATAEPAGGEPAGDRAPERPI